jgi:Protein of unknown function (DUF3313)
MNDNNVGSIKLGIVAALSLLAGCQTTKPSPIDEASTQDGLVRVESKAVDAVYKRPDATLTGYSKLLLRPVDVQFAKNWDPSKSGSVLYQMHEPDREKIRSDLAELFRDEVRRDLEKGGYPLVDTAGPDVLEMRAAIVNLYINAPDVSMQTPGRTRVYTTDAGEMTLILQLHDSVTGQLLARAYDRRAGTGSATWNWSNSVTNSAEARRIISVWATELRKALDASRSAG